MPEKIQNWNRPLLYILESASADDIYAGRSEGELTPGARLSDLFQVGLWRNAPTPILPEHRIRSLRTLAHDGWYHSDAMRIRRMPFITSVFLVGRSLMVCALSMLPAIAPGQVPLNGQSSSDVPSIVAKVSPAVVLIKGESSAGTTLGSGLIVSRDGKIATNLHVMRDLKTAGAQLASGEIFDVVSVLAFDDRKDLAIIKIAGFDLPTVELGNSNDIRIGERVVAIGSPLGLQGTVTTGVVSAVRDDPFGSGAKVIQTDASINPGNSGGPLLNDRGQAIGVVRFSVKQGGQGEGLNFAMPINYVRGMLDNLQKPMSLDELRANLLSVKTDVFKSSPGYPALWKSLSSGAIRKLRFEGDIIYAETVLTEEQRKFEFDSYELKKDKDGSYKGTIRSGSTCVYPAPALTWDYGKMRQNRCQFEKQVEFTSVTPNRIEGRASVPPADAKFDCKRCSYSKPNAWTPFVWIPQ
jgi:S1-C subfamily serine protease